MLGLKRVKVEKPLDVQGERLRRHLDIQSNDKNHGDQVLSRVSVVRCALGLPTQTGLLQARAEPGVAPTPILSLESTAALGPDRGDVGAQ